LWIGYGSAIFPESLMLFWYFLFERTENERRERGRGKGEEKKGRV
jgi:hypothetical protein